MSSFADRVCRLLLLALLVLMVAPLSGSPAARAAEADDAAAGPGANRRFVEAMKAIAKADQSYDPEEQGKFLREADRLLTQIVTESPESPLAVQLVTNQYVGDFDYGEFQNRLRGLVCADATSTPCFLHRIEGLMSPIEFPIAAPRWDWLSLAVGHYLLGEKPRVRPIVAPFLAAFRQQGIPGAGSQDLFLSRALALTGEIDLALKMTRQITDCSTRIYNLHDITDALVLMDRRELAAQLADEANEYARASGCSWELGLVAQSLLRVGAEARARTLFLNTVEEQFSRFKDRAPTPQPSASASASSVTGKPSAAGKGGECCPPELAIAAGDLGDPNLALGLLRVVQDGSPWAIPQVLGRLAARGEFSVPLAYADQVKDLQVRAESYVALIAGALRAGDPAQAAIVSSRLDAMLAGPTRDPVVLVQRARADRLLQRNALWRGVFMAALSEAEKADGGGEQRRDFAVPFLAALVEIETGRPLLD
jgi:hypothetical protein